MQNGNSINISISVGVSLSPELGEDFNKLIDYADKAMYEAKKSKGASFSYYAC